MVQATFKSLNQSNNGNMPTSRRKKSEIPGSICILPISVGQEYHKGERGFAILNLLVKSLFSKIFIIVVDDLQAWTIMAKENCSYNEALQKARSGGDEWIEWFEQQKQREPLIEKLPVEIIRWGAYNKETIKDEIAVVKKWKQENFQSFKNVIGTTAAGFFRGAVGQSHDLIERHRITLFFENSLQYLQLEVAAAIKWQEQFVRANPDKTVFLAYPREPNPVISFVLNKAQPPYRLEAVMLVIRFDSPKLSRKVASASQEEQRSIELSASGTSLNENISSDSESSSPPEPSFLNGMQAELDALRGQVRVIPVLTEQLQHTNAILQHTNAELLTLQQNVFFLYQKFITAGAGESSVPNVAMLPTPGNLAQSFQPVNAPNFPLAPSTKEQGERITPPT